MSVASLSLFARGFLGAHPGVRTSAADLVARRRCPGLRGRRRRGAGSSKSKPRARNPAQVRVAQVDTQPTSHQLQYFSDMQAQCRSPVNGAQKTLEKKHDDVVALDP